MDAHRSVSPDPIRNETRTFLRCQPVRSAKNDQEQWWTGKCREMKKAAANGNSRNVYRLIRGTGPWKPSVRAVIKEYDGTLIPSQDCRLACWAGHFREQFGWPTVTVGPPVITVNSYRGISAPFIGNGGGERNFPQRYKASASDELSPSSSIMAVKW